MSDKITKQYDLNHNFIRETKSVKEMATLTGISGYRIRMSSQKGKVQDGFYFEIIEPTPWDIPAICENCGKEFISTKQRLAEHTHSFCCQKCAGEYKHKNIKLNTVCCICGKPIHRKASQVRRYKGHVTCSKECLTLLQRQNMSGEKNHQYGLKGDKNASWKSDEKISYYGYRLIRKLDHPYKNSDGFVFEHRLIAEKYLLTDENSVEINGKRYLSKDFVVHHIDFDRLNNNIDNLYVMRSELHAKFHIMLNNYVRSDKNGRIIGMVKNDMNYTKEQLEQLLKDFMIENTGKY